MTDKQPEALEMATELEEDGRWRHAALLRTQHAEIERLNAAATDSNLLLERAQATNLEMLAAIERKDALLRQALGALDLYKAYGWPDRSGVIPAITKELSQ